MSFDTHQIVRQLMPDTLHYYLDRRPVFLKEMQKLIAEFRTIHKDYIFYKRSYLRDARTAESRKHLLQRLNEATGFKRDILKEYADLKRCIRIIDDFLFGGTEAVQGAKPH